MKIRDAILDKLESEAFDNEIFGEKFENITEGQLEILLNKLEEDIMNDDEIWRVFDESVSWHLYHKYFNNDTEEFEDAKGVKVWD